EVKFCENKITISRSPYSLPSPILPIFLSRFTNYYTSDNPSQGQTEGIE
ncbi:hypothetical protein LINPERHAP1_LOCUS32028, partial [Linum perenne]